MQDKELSTQAASNKFFAAYDAQQRSAAAQQLYTTAQQEQAKALHELTRTAFFRSKVYLTYRDKFYTVKIAKPTGADRLSKEASNIEQVFKAIGAEKAITAQGVIYRVSRI